MVCLLCAPGPAWTAEKRVALVIGAGAYRHAPALANPPNDARLIGPLLTKLGFETETVIDPANRAALEEAVRRFSKRMEGATATLFFYAGHGLQVNGRNYLLPLDAKVEQEADLRWETLDVQTVLDQMDAPGRVNLVFLDACRDNPLSRSLAGRMGGRSTLVGRGLSREERIGGGTLIVYATDPGEIAADGTGANSPFTAALGKYLIVPGLEVHEVIRRVRVDVLAATGRKQRPWENSGLEHDFYFTPLPVQPVLPQAAAPVPAAEEAVEREFWAVARDSNDIKDVAAYLTTWPNGRFVVLARNKLERMRLAMNGTPPAVRPPEPPRTEPSPPQPVAGGVIRDCPICPALVLIPAGSFMMGIPEAESKREGRGSMDGDARPVHPVTIRRSFYLGQTPVTRGEYQSCVDAGKCDKVNAPNFAQTDAHPVVNVSHEDARAYVTWLRETTRKDHRLPGEAEWEYAARSGTRTARYQGDDFVDSRGDTVPRAKNATMPVKSFRPNQFGLYDMLGHVWQWMGDCWKGSYKDNFPSTEEVVTTGDCGRRVIRGAAWYSDPWLIRAGFRDRFYAGNRDAGAGFRVARTYSSP